VADADKTRDQSSHSTPAPHIATLRARVKKKSKREKGVWWETDITMAGPSEGGERTAF
jgi:hypothetical protein